MPFKNINKKSPTNIVKTKDKKYKQSISLITEPIIILLYTVSNNLPINQPTITMQAKDIRTEKRLKVKLPNVRLVVLRRL